MFAAATKRMVYSKFKSTLLIPVGNLLASVQSLSKLKKRKETNNASRNSKIAPSSIEVISQIQLFVLGVFFLQLFLVNCVNVC